MNGIKLKTETWPIVEATLDLEDGFKVRLFGESRVEKFFNAWGGYIKQGGSIIKMEQVGTMDVHFLDEGQPEFSLEALLGMQQE
ncbi:MAG TPA: hypothetical protein EYF95_05420 [Flavobacteriales bacterium]|jgi:hypothetical protein|nr:hypothetical protein [Flavobacteriales bacterium]